jgi:hypothetical protein
MPFTKSDLLLVAPSGILAERIERLSRHLRLAIDVNVNDVVPGEPIVISWQFNIAPQTGSYTVRARFLIDGFPVHERSAIQVSAALKGSGPQTETIAIGAPLATYVYKWGLRRLDIEVQGEGREVLQYHARRVFQVVPEQMNSSWWHWGSISSQSLDWKDAYSLTGKFTNKTRYAVMKTVKMGMTEVRREPNPLIDPCEYEYDGANERTATDVQPGQSVDLSLTFLKDWEWLDKNPPFLISGPLNKSFAYAVLFTGTDEFGNTYGWACSASIIRYINVSQEKWFAGVNAMMGGITAAGLSIAAAALAASIVGLPAAGVLAAAAAAALFAAKGWAGLARDPAAPDPRFREPVRVPSLTLPPWPANPDGPSLSGVRGLFEVAAKLIALEQARTTTRARLLGARAASDMASLRLQEDGYRQIEHQTSEIVLTLDRLADEAQREVEGIPVLDPDQLTTWFGVIAREGFPQAAVEAMSKANLSPAQIGELAAAARHPFSAEVIAANGLFLKQFALGMQAFVRSAQARSKQILAGEIYIPPPQRLEEPFGGDEYSESDHSRRRRHRCC